MELVHRTVRTNGIDLHVVTSGPEDGPLVILLHGFPEYWRGFEKQIDALAGAGFHVWTPDQRGYNQSDKPEGIAAYGIDELAADVAGLIDAAGRKRALIAGHDWGAAAAWWTAIRFPQRVERLAILNVPHPAVMQRYILRRPSQMRRSWYMLFFQIPRLPEWLLRRDNYAAMTAALKTTAQHHRFSDEELDHYRRAWDQPGAVTSMLNWYRALFRVKSRPVHSVHLSMPVRIIWGKRDAALEWPMAEQSLEYCQNGELFFLDEATHWVQHDEPDRVNELLLSFFAATETGS